MASKWVFAMFSAADVDDDGSLTETCDIDATESEKQQRYTINYPIHTDWKEGEKNSTENLQKVVNWKEKKGTQEWFFCPTDARHLERSKENIEKY